MKKLNLFSLILFSIALFTFTACDKDDDVGPDSADMTIAEIVADDDRFETLLSLLERTDLANVLDGNGPYTVFAPTDDAFSALGVNPANLTDDELSDILLYHVLGGEVESGDLAEGQTYATTASMAGYDDNAASLLIERSGNTVSLNGSANVIDADIETRNGVIHVIDRVLLPAGQAG